MEYAIVEISGRQVWVEPGKYYDVNRISAKLGSIITLNRVLFANSNNDVRVGNPYLLNVVIEAKILEHLRDNKIIVYKMRPKKKTRKKQGHRQELTRILIQKIT